MEITCNNKEDRNIQSKRVDLVSIRMIREGSVIYRDRKINSPQDAVNLIRAFLENADREQLIVCCINTKNEPTAIHTASIGSLNSSIVHPREIFKVAILSNSSSIIIFHNHPSGDPTPSNEDINITHRLNEAGKIIGIDLIDHIIIGEKEFVSLKEKGIL